MKDKLKKAIDSHSFLFFLSVSFGFHILLIVVLLFSHNLGLIFTKNKKVIVPASIRVDMVGLPDLPSKKVKRLKKKKPVLIPEKATKKAKPKKQTKAKKKPKAKPKKKTAKKENKLKKDGKTQNNQNKKSNVNKGNQVREGADKGANSLNPQQISEINTYFSEVERQIKSHWNLPKYLMDMNLTAQIEVRIDNRGRMTSKQLVGSSGNELFDSYVLKAMENASPYPSPPVSVQKIIKDGIVFTMHSRQ